MQRILKPEVQGAISKLDDEMRLLVAALSCMGNWFEEPATELQLSHLKKYNDKKTLKSDLMSDRKNWILVDHGEFWDLK
jgi:hypothetical protein